MAGTTRIGQGYGIPPAPTSEMSVQDTSLPAPVRVSSPQPSMMPRIIQALSKRTQELAYAIVAIRNGQLGRDEAERRLPGMSRLVGPDGYWNEAQVLEAAAQEMAQAGDPRGVDRLIGKVTSLISSGRIGGAGASPRPAPLPVRAAVQDAAGPGEPAHPHAGKP
jgi:hypothetical protein